MRKKDKTRKLKYKIIKSEKGMINFAARFSKRLRGGETIALIGKLGTGKTTFVKGIAKGLAIKERILSPTFLLIKCYRGKKVGLCHIDAYRIKNYQELIDAGVQELLAEKKTVKIIEWADRVKELLPPKAQVINFEYGRKKNERVIKLNK